MDRDARIEALGFVIDSEALGFITQHPLTMLLPTYSFVRYYTVLNKIRLSHICCTGLPPSLR